MRHSLICANGVIVFQGLKTRVVVMLHLSLASTTWHIGAIWQRRHFPTSHWLEKLNLYYSPCIFIFLIFLRSTWSMEVGRMFLNTKFEDFSECQNLMDFHS
jgi:hypothetical protein